MRDLHWVSLPPPPYPLPPSFHFLVAFNTAGSLVTFTETSTERFFPISLTLYSSHQSLMLHHFFLWPCTSLPWSNRDQVQTTWAVFISNFCRFYSEVTADFTNVYRLSQLEEGKHPLSFSSLSYEFVFSFVMAATGRNLATNEEVSSTRSVVRQPVIRMLAPVLTDNWIQGREFNYSKLKSVKHLSMLVI